MPHTGQRLFREALTSKSSIPKGYHCGCETFHAFTPWVFAHMDIEINHKCDCGRVNTILQAQVVRVELRVTDWHATNAEEG